MKVIIAGTRTFTDYELLVQLMDTIRENTDITEIVCGMAQGADLLGKQYGDERNILVKPFRADWNQFGKAAGPIRNKQMAEYADVLVAFWDGKSPGTRNMINLMHKENKIVYVFDVLEQKVNIKQLLGL